MFKLPKTNEKATAPDCPFTLSNVRLPSLIRAGSRLRCSHSYSSEHLLLNGSLSDAFSFLWVCKLFKIRLCKGGWLLLSKEGKAPDGCERSHRHQRGCFLSGLPCPCSSLEMNMPSLKSRSLCPVDSSSLAMNRIHQSSAGGRGDQRVAF